MKRKTKRWNTRFLHLVLYHLFAYTIHVGRSVKASIYLWKQTEALGLGLYGT